MVTETTPQSSVVNYLSFYVNGKEVIERHAEPDWTLLWYLRNSNPKLGCGEGGCGACTVLVSRCIDRNSGEIEHRTINSCLTLLCSVDGCHVITVEGLGSTNKSNLHPTQSRLAELSASQCGFCTPGMVMSVYGIVTSKNDLPLTMQDIEESLDGNLCRCTGYRPILDAAKTFACDIDKLPKEKSSKLTSTTLDKCLSFAKENVSPSDQPGDASKLIFGNTRVQIETKFEHRKYSRLISVTHIKELQRLEQTADSLFLGAGVTFTRLQSKLIEWNNEKNNDGGICQALLYQLKHFASTQIRNVASLGGNIVTASPISDVNPILQAAGAILELHRADSDTARHVPLSDFFLGHHHVAMIDDEVLVAVHIPLPQTSSKCFLRSYKQACRRDDSKGIVSAGLRVQLEQSNSADDQWRIVSTCFSFGGMASATIIAKNTQQELVGLSWTRATMNKACELILKEMPLDELSPGGRPEYRRTLIQSFLFKFYVNVCFELRQSSVDLTHLSTVHPFHRAISHGQQTIPERPSSQKIVGSSLSHRSAYLHTTREAMYTADLPSLVNTLHAALVLSSKANTRIKHIDIETASHMPGFVSFISHIDVPGSNKLSYGTHYEELFVSSVALCIGAIVGVVICETEESARLASNLVQIEYELLTPTILTIEDAIANESFFDNEQCLRQDDIDKGFAEAEHTLEGTLMIGGQEHFYLETNSYMVIPSNDDKELQLYLGTQDPSAAQELIALALDRDISHITCHVKRIGGGFGGKISKS
ncbi:unnamed protein product [Rotaria sp. Silwood1]|nr:unnamed protein product [Rotaria sp. Silwood1]